MEATFTGTLISTGGETEDMVLGFIYSTSPNPLYDGADVSSVSVDVAIGNFAVSVSDLLDITEYFVKAFFKNSVGIVYSNEESFTTLKALSIPNLIKSHTINIYPNPTSSTSTISFELEKLCDVKVSLTDILGSELFEVYNGFADAGMFLETISTEHLATGIYFIKVQIDGNYVIEKIVVE